jgi:hypothetical protein
MTLFDDLAANMDSLVGTGVGGWVLGIFVIAVLLIPLVFLSRTKSVSEKAFFFLGGAGLVFDVGVGWWQPWTLVFIFGLLIWGGLLFRREGGGEGMG